MADDWPGHPQRKDYPLGGIPAEYIGSIIGLGIGCGFGVAGWVVDSVIGAVTVAGFGALAHPMKAI